MPSSHAYPSLERKKGKKDNWVERAGGLPSYIERIAKHLHYEKGHSISTAIAMAVNTVKRWATGTNHNGSKLKPATVAKAAKAVAEWTAKKAKGKLKEGALSGVTATPDELNELLEAEMATFRVLAGIRETLVEDPRQLALANARAFMGLGSTKLDLAEAAQPADPERVGEALGLVEDALSELEPFIEMLGGEELLTEARGTKVKRKLPTAKEAAGKEASTRSAHLQRRLTSLGFEAKDDGKYGPKTEAEVKAFQRHAGLKEDGVVGPKTTQALQKAPTPEDMEDPEDAAAPAAAPEAGAAPKPEAPAPAADADASGAAVAKPQAAKTRQIGGSKMLNKGIAVGEEKGDRNVEELQAYLEELGYPNIAIDGKFGPETERSVKSFQKKMGLKTDGLVGPKTKTAMGGLHRRLTEAINRREAASPADFPAALAAEKVIRRRVEEGWDPKALKEAEGKSEKEGVSGGGAMKRCPSCGWRMKPGTTKCGKCKANLRKKGDAKAKAKGDGYGS